MSFTAQPPRIVGKRFVMGENGKFVLKYEYDNARFTGATKREESGYRMVLTSNFAKKRAKPSYAPSFVNVNDRKQALEIMNRPC